ncbi:hypothetical protein EIK77_003891 [Talaromyces pinophilus]|nr:hypothetical protein EIK77_003891 [Talaromyces pinophilus]
MSVRKAHNAGRNHIRNVVDYYQRQFPPNTTPLKKHISDWLSNWWTEIGHEKAQSVIDSITSSYAAEGQANPLLQHPGQMPPPPFGIPPPGAPAAPLGRGIPPFQPPFPIPGGAPVGGGAGLPPSLPAGMPPLPGNLPFPPPPPGGLPANFQPPPGFPGGAGFPPGGGPGSSISPPPPGAISGGGGGFPPAGPPGGGYRAGMER